MTLWKSASLSVSILYLQFLASKEFSHTHTQMFTAIQFYSCDNKLAHNTKNSISLSLSLFSFQIIYYSPNVILNIILAYKIDRQYYYLFLIRVLSQYSFRILLNPSRHHLGYIYILYKAKWALLRHLLNYHQKLIHIFCIKHT